MVLQYQNIEVQHHCSTRLQCLQSSNGEKKCKTSFKLLFCLLTYTILSVVFLTSFLLGFFSSLNSNIPRHRSQVHKKCHNCKSSSTYQKCHYHFKLRLRTLRRLKKSKIVPTKSLVRQPTPQTSLQKLIISDPARLHRNVYLFSIPFDRSLDRCCVVWLLTFQC